MRFRSIFLVLLSLAQIPLPALATDIDHDIGLEPGIKITLPAEDGRLAANLLVEPIVGGLEDRTDLFTIIRPSVSFRPFLEGPLRSLTLTVGADRNLLVTDDADFIETRPWQGVSFAKKFGRVTLYDRMRVEQRIFDHNDTQVRFRNKFRGTFDLTTDGDWYLLASEEIFVNVNTVSGSPSGFDLSWSFLGVGHRVTENLTVEAGYAFQYENRPSPVSDRAISFFFTTAVVRLPKVSGFKLPMIPR